MSKPYRIVVTKVVEQEVRSEDRSTLKLDLDELLGADRTTELLARVLERRGWTELEPGRFERPGAVDESTVCDVASREVTTTVVAERTLSERRQREIRGDTWDWKAMREKTPEEMAEVRRREEEKLDAAISEQRVRQTEDELRQAAAQRLADGADERRREVNRLVLEVTGEALKEHAQKLGSVGATQEAWHGEDYELTISISE